MHSSDARVFPADTLCRLFLRIIYRNKNFIRLIVEAIN
jgi:hypothetical protein